MWDAPRFGPINLWVVHPAWKIPSREPLTKLAAVIETRHQQHPRVAHHAQRVIAEILRRR
jgi:hypothetical protein